MEIKEPGAECPSCDGENATIKRRKFGQVNGKDAAESVCSCGFRWLERMKDGIKYVVGNGDATAIRLDEAKASKFLCPACGSENTRQLKGVFSCKDCDAMAAIDDVEAMAKLRAANPGKPEDDGDAIPWRTTAAKLLREKYVFGGEREPGDPGTSGITVEDKSGESEAGIVGAYAGMYLKRALEDLEKHDAARVGLLEFASTVIALKQTTGGIANIAEKLHDRFVELMADLPEELPLVVEPGAGWGDGG